MEKKIDGGKTLEAALMAAFMVAARRGQEQNFIGMGVVEQAKFSIEILAEMCERYDFGPGLLTIPMGYGNE